MIPAVPTTVNRSSRFEDSISRYFTRRGWPIAASALFVTAGLLYIFRWSPLVWHRRSLWVMPSDIWTTYGAASAAAHGHFASIYGGGNLAFPGFLAVLAPLGALAGRFHTTYVQVTSNGHPFTGTNVYTSSGTPTVLYDGLVNRGNLYAVHQGVFMLLAPFMLLVSCTAVFAFDAMAEFLEVVRWRRAVLAGVEVVLLWGLVVVAGHPEDALAVALATWALLWAFEDRWTGTGWLFGVALAIQPLVIVVFPILLVLGGRQRTIGLLIRGAIPVVAVVVGPLVADAHDTLHALVDQPTFPNLPADFKTLWTPLAPHLGGHGSSETLGGGPIRLVALALAAGIGWFSLRWRQRPEMIIWAAALALALRVYTESVMTAYYTWPALALGVVIACRAATWRFWAAVSAALVTTVIGQWHIDNYVWWAVQVIGVTVVLAAAAQPRAPETAPPEPARRRPPVGSRPSGGSTKKRQPARR
jgi:hypothetical protein